LTALYVWLAYTGLAAVRQVQQALNGAGYNVGEPDGVWSVRTADQLRSFLQDVGVPLLGFLRDTQNYVHLAAHGLTLWDVASTRFQGDREQWEPIVTWVN